MYPGAAFSFTASQVVKGAVSYGVEMVRHFQEITKVEALIETHLEALIEIHLEALIEIHLMAFLIRTED